MFDGKAFGQEIVEIVRGHVSRSLEPLIERIAALEARHPERGEKGEPGEPGEPGPAGEPGARGEDGAPGRDGKDADPEAVAGILAAQMQDEIESVIDRAVAERVKAAVAAIPAPKDGVGLAGALIDRDGNLVITLTDGSTRPLGPVVGCDGKDGAPGKDGADGLGFDDMTAAYDGERRVTLRFERGDQVKEYAFEMPVIIDRGVYKAGERYSAGDGVTWAGSYWIAQEATTEKPDTGKGWRLAVKRGRDGKAAA